MYSKKAISLAPNNAGLIANYALALLLDRQGDEALKTIKKACELDTNDMLIVMFCLILRTL